MRGVVLMSDIGKYLRVEQVRSLLGPQNRYIIVDDLNAATVFHPSELRGTGLLLGNYVQLPAESSVVVRLLPSACAHGDSQATPNEPNEPNTVPDEPSTTRLTPKQGLLWRGNDMVPLHEADRLARRYGLVYAERLIAIMNEPYVWKGEARDYRPEDMHTRHLFMTLVLIWNARSPLHQRILSSGNWNHRMCELTAYDDDYLALSVTRLAIELSSRNDLEPSWRDTLELICKYLEQGRETPSKG